MASSSAAWVLGGVRLISSARTTLANRAFEEFEFAVTGVAIFVHHVGAGDIAWHEIGGELDAIEIQRQALRQRADEQRLGQTGHTFKDAVTAGEEADQKLFDHFVLTDDHPADLRGFHRGPGGGGAGRQGLVRRWMDLRVGSRVLRKTRPFGPPLKKNEKS